MRRLTGSDVEAILAGEAVEDGAHRGLSATISALGSLPAPADGPTIEARALATFMANRTTPAQPRRPSLISRILASKLASATVVASLATTGGVAAAAGGVLPAPAQNFVSGAAKHLGVSLPSDPPAVGSCPATLAIDSMDATITADGAGVLVTIETSGTAPYMSAGGTGWSGTVSPDAGGFAGSLTWTGGGPVAPGTPVYAGACGLKASAEAHYPGQPAPTSAGPTTTTTTPGSAAGAPVSPASCLSGLAIDSMDATITPDGKGVSVSIHTTGTFPYLSVGGTGWTGSVQPVAGGFSGTLTRTDGSTVVAGTEVAAGACGLRASTEAHYPGQPAPTSPAPTTTTTTRPPTASGTTSQPNCPPGLVIDSMDATITSDGKGVFVTIHTTGTFPYMSAGGTGWYGTVSPDSTGFSGTLTWTNGGSVTPGTPVAAGSCGQRASTEAHYAGQPAPTSPSSTTTTTTTTTPTTTSHSNCPSGLAIDSMDATITANGTGVFVTIETTGTFPYMSAGGTGWSGSVSPDSNGFSGTLTWTNGGTVPPGTVVAAGACGQKASTEAHN